MWVIVIFANLLLGTTIQDGSMSERGIIFSLIWFDFSFCFFLFFYFLDNKEAYNYGHMMYHMMWSHRSET